MCCKPAAWRWKDPPRNCSATSRFRKSISASVRAPRRWADSALAPLLPQRFQALPERPGFFREQAMRDACGALRERSGAFGTWRREARAPARQSLMRRGEMPEHFKVLAATESFAQPFGFLGPHPAEPRPEWLPPLPLGRAVRQRAGETRANRLGRPPSNRPECAAARCDNYRPTGPRWPKSRTDRAAIVRPRPPRCRARQEWFRAALA